MGNDRIREIEARVALKSHFGFLPPQTQSDLRYLLDQIRERDARIAELEIAEERAARLASGQCPNCGGELETGVGDGEHWSRCVEYGGCGYTSGWDGEHYPEPKP